MGILKQKYYYSDSTHTSGLGKRAQIPIPWWNGLLQDIDDLITNIEIEVDPSRSRGYYATSAELPTPAVLGDIALVGETSTIWRYDGSIWIDTTIPGLVAPSDKDMLISLSAETGLVPTGELYRFYPNKSIIIKSITMSANVEPSGGPVVVEVYEDVILIATVTLADGNNAVTLTDINYVSEGTPEIRFVSTATNSCEGLKIILNYE